LVERGSWPYEATYRLQPWDPWAGEHIGEIEFHAPFDRDSTRLSARVTVAAEGWDFEAEVDIPFCEEVTTCDCPCE
jgi:hypothetical protein